MSSTQQAAEAAVNAAAHDFSYFLGGFDPARFFAEHWERRSLYLPHGDSGRFAHLISAESLFGREVARCGHLKASTRAADGWNQEIRIQPEQAQKLFRAGMTICASMLDEAGPCGEVIAAYRRAITTGAPPHVNCYYSPEGRGYGLHFDTHPVWILQVSGSKHWTVGLEPAVRNPPFNVVFPPDRDHVKLPWIALDRPNTSDPERFMQVHLQPGDVLYMPAGCWHAARAEGSSMALTLALGRLSTFDLFSFLLSRVTERRLPEVTSRLAPFPRPELLNDAAPREALRAQIAADLERLRAAIARLDAESLLELYEFHAEHPETLLASRQFAHASSQVASMKRLYADDAPRKAGSDA